MGKRLVITIEEDQGYIESKLCVYNENDDIARKISVSDPFESGRYYLCQDVPLSVLLANIYSRSTQ